MFCVWGNWVWGGGWLAQLGANFGFGHGHVDFAGSSVVHMVGGVAALAGTIDAFILLHYKVLLYIQIPNYILK
ncbi:MAG: hypothetical protein H7263_17725 [Candidatus Sericytochromatia bacterium]|nr:hypothetical protein [Candidatus Sericytochromatia bacterium]